MEVLTDTKKTCSLIRNIFPVRWIVSHENVFCVFCVKANKFLDSFTPGSAKDSANLIALQLIICPDDYKGKVANENGRYKFAKG